MLAITHHPNTEQEWQASSVWGAGKGSRVPPLEGSLRLQEAHCRLGLHQYQE